MRAQATLALFAVLFAFPSATPPRSAPLPRSAQQACSADLTLPAGFCATVVAESLGPVRHIVVAPNGDIWAARRGQNGGLILIRDGDGDGRAETIRRFYANNDGGSGVALAGDAIYYAPNDAVLRFPWPAGRAEPDSVPQRIVRGLPVGGHAAKGIAIGRDGRLYVSIGSLTNSCQERDRQNRSPGVQPCTELEQRAGVWRFDPRREGQHAHLGARVATGLRNPMAVSIEPTTGTLYAAVHGRDQLTENWGWPAEAGRENPAEVVFALPDGTDGGWPYCYHDPRTRKQLLTPEYGGDGTRAGDCGSKAAPAIVFPAHWAPNGTQFYTGTQFPASYRGGMFIAFHGSWNRAPAPQEGFRVVFAPFRSGRAVGTFENFATPSGTPTSIRPVGLAVGPDGSLYVSADNPGKIWRIRYSGSP
jgi:glucose/arabinose dehydrogenase